MLEREQNNKALEKLKSPMPGMMFLPCLFLPRGNTGFLLIRIGCSLRVYCQ